jgi:hypothetical protein
MDIARVIVMPSDAVFHAIFIRIGNKEGKRCVQIKRGNL